MTGAGIPQQDRRAAEVSGRVRDPGGRPVSAAAVTLVDVAGRQIGRGTTDETGTFGLRTPGRGGYVLIASAPAHQPEAITVNVAETPVWLEVELRSAGGLRGVVRAGETGVPIMNAAVTLTDLRGEVVDSRLSGAGGEYAFTSLPSGAYTLAVSASGYRPAALAVTTEEAVATRQDVELADGAVIHGSVRLPEGPRPAVTVTLLDNSGQVVRTTTVDRTGRYAFHDLDPGTYTVVASSYSPVRHSVRIGGGTPTRHDVQLA
jgi:uncharacterized surface anchored protein